ncbi:MAG: signal peptidase II [Nitratireductor sp.]
MALRISIAFIICLVALDQFSKYIVETYLPFHAQVKFIPFLSWYRTYNEGVAFSMLSWLNDWALVGITVLIIGFVLWLWKNTEKSKIYSHLGFAFVLGGAIGNLIDRIYLGYVIDFIQFHTATWSFAIFNVADMFVNIGAALIIFDELFMAKRKIK